MKLVVLVSSFVFGSDLRKPEVNGARDAVELNNSFAGDIGAVGPQFAG